MNMTMLKPLWEGIWMGIFGLFFAFGLKKREKYAWTLSLFWGIMMITNAAIQGGYEIFILGWSKVCLQTYMFLMLGVIALVSLLITRKEFS
jgi:cell division protein FtsX